MVFEREKEFTLIRRIDNFSHDVVDFIYLESRILVAERKMWIYSIVEQSSTDRKFITGPEMSHGIREIPIRPQTEQSKYPKTDNYPDEIRFH
jgi:hypothetical protein